MQCAKWDAAIKPVSNPLRVFDEHGKACFVPTDGPCYIGFEPGTEIHPGIRLDRGTACQVGPKVYRNPKYDPIHQPGYLATNGYTRGNSTNGSNKDNTDCLARAPIESTTVQIKTDYETAHGYVH